VRLIGRLERALLTGESLLIISVGCTVLLVGDIDVVRVLGRVFKVIGVATLIGGSRVETCEASHHSSLIGLFACLL